MATVPSSYLQHLPEIFRAASPDGEAPFLGEFLKIFEALLAGRADAPATQRGRGLEEIMDLFPEYIDPELTPIDNPNAAPGESLRSDFLNYLASWAALALDQNWDLEKKREWTRRIIPLYKRRGTRDGLQDYLDTFVGNNVRILEPPGGFILAVQNTILGINTILAGSAAYFFIVVINYGFAPQPFNITDWVNIQKGTRAIIDLEKPAHTYYRLDARTPGFILARPGHTVLAQHTLLWQSSEPF